MSVLWKIYRFLASIKLAVCLLVALAVILATATYYESVYDTKTAQHLVYASPGFALFLGVLWINIFCAAAIRFPWKRYQTGFVVTHLGLLILLVGSLVTMLTGVDSTMAIEEGKSAQRVALDQPVFFYGPAQQDLKEFPAEFRWSPPEPDKPVRIKLDGTVVARVDRYLHHAQLQTDYVASPEGGVPAVQLRIHNSRVDMSEWLNLSKGTLPLGPATVYLQRLKSEAQVQAFLKGDLEPGGQGELQLLLGVTPEQIPVSELEPGQPRQVGDYTVELVRYLPYAVVDEKRNSLTSRSDEPINPAVEIIIRDGQKGMQRWLLFSRLPNLNTRLASQGHDMPVRAMYAFDTVPKDQKSLFLGIGPTDNLVYRMQSGVNGTVEVGKQVATGWMDLQFEITSFLPQARERREFREVKLEAKTTGEQEGPPPAILVTLEGAQTSGPYWLERGDVVEVKGPQGQPMVFGYGMRSLDTGVLVKLKDFEIGYDPGTRTPASFQSTVVVDGQDHVISMNEPLVKNGYKFFQASYSEVPGRPVVSVLQVSKDPGIGLKYLGSILLVLGISIMFYMKPYFNKRSRPASAAPPHNGAAGGEAVTSLKEEVLT